MENKNRDRIKLKIKALLAKTTENGATEQEALSALEKAQELMMENFISEHEITDPYLAEKCVFKNVPKVKSTYNLTVFLNDLAELFDCEYYFNNLEVTFFGFEEDTELCAYFYNFIIQACFAERNKYMLTDEYKELQAQYNGRTLVASFVRGFLVGITLKMREIYRSRKQQLSNEVGLMVTEKVNKVKDQFAQVGPKVRTVPVKGGVYEAAAFYQGKEKGEELSITQGINNSNSDRTLKITQK